MAWLALGWLLIVLTPFIGVLPGPGGVFVLAAGLALILRNSAWARRRYVLLKRRWPRVGHGCDRAMRRSSTLRRRALLKARGADAD